MEYSHEIILPNGDIPFKLFVFEGKDGNYLREKPWHRSVEIFALFQGELRFFINEREYDLRPGEFMLVNSNEIHSVLSPDRNFTVVLQIPLETFEKYYTDQDFIYFTHSSRLQDEEVMRLVREMYQVYVERKCGYELRVQSQFYWLLYLLVTKYRKVEGTDEWIRRNRRLGRLSSIIAYMKENYAGELSLSAVANTFGYSPTYLSRMFQKYAGTSYKAYLDSIRLQYGYQDLVNTECSIGEIAARNGFPNSKAFAKEFRGRYGVLPSQYRKSHRQSGEQGEKDRSLKG